MGFSFRRSLRLGPVRLNLSRSGIGVSTGIRGARIGLGPRGSYAQVGAQGFYYRTSLGPGRRQPPLPSGHEVPRNPKLADTGPDGLTDIESSDVAEMAPAEFREVLAHLEYVQKRFSRLKVAGWVVALGVLMMLSAASSLATEGRPIAAWTAVVVSAAVGIALILWARHSDVTFGTAALFYELPPQQEQAYSTLRDAFQTLTGCAGLWHIGAQGANHDLKHNAGATSLVRRASTTLRVGLPARIASNVTPPVLAVGRQQLCFLPDRILVFDGPRVGALTYSELHTEARAARFIEDGAVPRDAEVVGSTWQYVNKKGGPDKRFANNRQLSIALYGEVDFSSPSGLNERVQCSQPPVAKHLNDTLRWYGDTVRTAGSPSSVVSTAVPLQQDGSQSATQPPPAVAVPELPVDTAEARSYTDGRTIVPLYAGRGSFDIVGESKYQDALRSLANGRTQAGEKVVFTALVIPEPDNSVDTNAIAVYAEGVGQVGYFSRDDAVRYRTLAERLATLNAVGSCQAHLIGGWDDDASIGVKIALGGPKGVVERISGLG